MNSRDRLLAVINLEEPDFPSSGELLINPPVFDKMLGKKTAFWDLIKADNKINDLINMKYMAIPFGVCVTPEDYVCSQRKIGLDWIPLFCGRPEKPVSLGNVGQKNELRSDTGIKWYVGGNLDTYEDLEILKQLDPYDPGFVFNKVNKEAVKIAHENNMAVLAVAGSVFQDSIDTCGYETFLINVFKKPDLISGVLNFFSWWGAELTKQFVDLGVDAIISCDDMCNRNGPHVSPKYLRKMVFPLLRKQVREIQSKGVKVILHCCGNTYQILDDLVNYVGINGYHAIEPMAGMDIGLVKEKYGEKISLFGNVDCSHTLCFKTLEDVKVETIEVINKAASGGGLNVNSSNSIHNSVKLENFQMMIDTTHKYGKYFYCKKNKEKAAF
jgi:uroporphyrinogen-III decarboxylase